MEIIVTVFYIVACVLLFALAILVHEFGHFIVALKLGLKVEAFSIGFGPAIWKKKVNGVEYRISWIPLGGYVSIPDVDPEGTKALESSKSSGEKPAKEKIPAWKELLVAVAGPLMNIVLAVVLAVVLACIPSAQFGEVLLDVREVLADGPGAKSGIMAGDKIVAINGHAVRTKLEMQYEFMFAKGRESQVEVVRGGTNVTLRATPEFVKVNGVDEMPFLKVVLAQADGAAATPWMVSRNPLKQLASDASQIFRVLKGLTTPKEAKATAGALGGPVMIAEAIYNSMRHSVWDGLGFLRFLNVNLAILNLLPIPVLDGGLILFALIALVFRRRVPEKIVTVLSMGFMYLLIALMGILILKDSVRGWKIHTKMRAEGAEELRDGK